VDVRATRLALTSIRDMVDARRARSRQSSSEIGVEMFKRLCSARRDIVARARELVWRMFDSWVFKDCIFVEAEEREETVWVIVDFMFVLVRNNSFLCEKRSFSFDWKMGLGVERVMREGRRREWWVAMSLEIFWEMVERD